MANQYVEELKGIITDTWKDTTPVKRLGSGAYGVVFECEKRTEGTSLITKEAIKVIKIPRDYEDDYNEDSGLTREDYYTKLKDDAVKEIETMVNLKSPHVVHINEYRIVEQKEQFGWYILIKMDLLQNLKDAMKKNAGAPKEIVEASAIKLCRDMCDALEVCFNKGYVHRDIKPENIFVSDMGEYYLGDFGLAKKLEEQAKNVSSRGTETYVAPEVYTQGCSQLTDLYSLGLVLYKMVNNNCDVFQNPGDDALSKDTAQRIRLSGKEPIKLPSNCSGWFGSIVCKMCAYNPKDRFQSISEIRSILDSKKHADNVSAPQENTINNNTININNNVYAQANVTSVRVKGTSHNNKLLPIILAGAACLVIMLVTSIFLASKIKGTVAKVIDKKDEIVASESAADNDTKVSTVSVTDHVNLVDEKIVEGNGAEVRTDVENSLGDIFDKALTIGNAVGGAPGDRYATYYLGKEYERFVANYSCLEDYNINGDVSAIEIYADKNEEPIYREKYSRATAVTSIDIDVTGVEFLTIKVSNGTSSWFGLIISDGMLYKDGGQAVLEIQEREFSDGKLISQKIVEGNGAEVRTDVENSLGDTFDKALTIGNAVGGAPGDRYATYYLGKGYERFVANYSCLEDYNINGDVSTIEIYADENEEPIYREKYSRATAVTPIDIDVTGVEFLTIKVSNGTSSWFGLVVSDGILYAK